MHFNLIKVVYPINVGVMEFLKNKDISSIDNFS